MRKLNTLTAVLSLAALGLAVPTTTAQALSGCQAKWPGRDGKVRAWQHWNCEGNLLGETTGVDVAWGDGYGPFQILAADQASSVMNSGFTGGRDHVAFYYEAGYRYTPVCLSPTEQYADNLTDNYYPGSTVVVNDHIESHRWVTRDECSPGSWLT